MKRNNTNNTNEVVAILKKWAVEINDPRNDGWIQQGYKNQIKVAGAYLDELRNTIWVGNDTSIPLLSDTHGK